MPTGWIETMRTRIMTLFFSQIISKYPNQTVSIMLDRGEKKKFSIFLLVNINIVNKIHFVNYNPKELILKNYSVHKTVIHIRLGNHFHFVNMIWFQCNKLHFNESQYITAIKLIQSNESISSSSRSRSNISTCRFNKITLEKSQIHLRVMK